MDRTAGVLPTPLALQIVGLRLAARPTVSLEFLAERLRRASLLDELRMDGLVVRDRYAASYRHLDGASQRCLRALGRLAPDDVSPASVGKVLGIGALDADRLLENLVHYSLLASGAEHEGSIAYTVPTLVHAYARELATSEHDAERAEDEVPMTVGGGAGASWMQATSGLTAR